MSCCKIVKIFYQRAFCEFYDGCAELRSGTRYERVKRTMKVMEITEEVKERRLTWACGRWNWKYKGEGRDEG